MQVTLVQLASQACIIGETSKISVNHIFVPMHMVCVIIVAVAPVDINPNVGEVLSFPKTNSPLRDYDLSWQQGLFGSGEAGAQDKFVLQAKHCSARLGLVDNVTRDASTLKLPVFVDKE
jgi:hypothetical protein